MPKVEADTGPLQKTSHSIGATKPHKSTESHDDGRMVQYLSENFGNIDFLPSILHILHIWFIGYYRILWAVFFLKPKWPQLTHTNPANRWPICPSRKSGQNPIDMGKTSFLPISPSAFKRLFVHHQWRILFARIMPELCSVNSITITIITITSHHYRLHKPMNCTHEHPKKIDNRKLCYHLQ